MASPWPLSFFSQTELNAVLLQTEWSFHRVKVRFCSSSTFSSCGPKWLASPLCPLWTQLQLSLSLTPLHFHWSCSSSSAQTYSQPRTFALAIPSAWNTLPVDIVTTSLTSSLRSITSPFGSAVSTLKLQLAPPPLVFPFSTFACSIFSPWSLSALHILYNLILYYVTVCCLPPQRNISSWYCSLTHSKHRVPGLTRAEYLLSEWGGDLQAANTGLCGDLRKPVRGHMSSVVQGHDGRADKTSWAPVGGPVSLHDEGGVWLSHGCICAEAKGSLHSLTLHVDTFWNKRTKNRTVGKCHFVLLIADCLKQGNICQT